MKKRQQSSLGERFSKKRDLTATLCCNKILGPWKWQVTRGRKVLTTGGHRHALSGTMEMRSPVDERCLQLPCPFGGGGWKDCIHTANMVWLTWKTRDSFHCVISNYFRSTSDECNCFLNLLIHFTSLRSTSFPFSVLCGFIDFIRDVYISTIQMLFWDFVHCRLSLLRSLYGLFVRTTSRFSKSLLQIKINDFDVIC